MASKLQQVQAKVLQASQFVAKHGSAYHKQLLEQNKQYVVDPPTVEKCNELAKQLFYTRLAREYDLLTKNLGWINHITVGLTAFLGVFWCPTLLYQ